jgi:hypothetical protein
MLGAVSITVRPATRENTDSLVRLRLTNAERHVQLDPAVHRLPDADIVRSYFEGALPADSNTVILVAEVTNEVTGMAEVVILPDPPGHQILLPRRAAEIHTVTRPASS